MLSREVRDKLWREYLNESGANFSGTVGQTMEHIINPNWIKLTYFHEWLRTKGLKIEFHGVKPQIHVENEEKATFYLLRIT